MLAYYSLRTACSFGLGTIRARISASKEYGTAPVVKEVLADMFAALAPTGGRSRSRRARTA